MNEMTSMTSAMNMNRVDKNATCTSCNENECDEYESRRRECNVYELQQRRVRQSEWRWPNQMHDRRKPIMARAQVTINNANDARTRSGDTGKYVYDSESVG